MRFMSPTIKDKYVKSVMIPTAYLVNDAFMDAIKLNVMDSLDSFLNINDAEIKIEHATPTSSWVTFMWRLEGDE